MRYFFATAYDGTNYHGWQRQENAVSVQQVLEEALSAILRTEITIVGSGRTDTGVHCKQQFFHADFMEFVDEAKLTFQLNSFLPKDISINSIKRVEDHGHARFSAIARSYQYKINTKKDPFLKPYSYYFPKVLNIQLMNEACTFLVGDHDFESFSKVKTEVNNFRCIVSIARWKKEENNVFFDITANRFLRGMVRAVVGTLLRVGQGNLSLKDFQQIILSKDRRKAGAAAPAHGLFLRSVQYPSTIFV
ncbi:MAG: tRNA pseudouridine(38-40) synthase TruA [Bacteroidota bacterium]